MKRSVRVSIFFLLAFSLSSCSSARDSARIGALRGEWENDKRTLIFDKNIITISYKGNGKIKAIRGPFDIDDSEISFHITEFSTDGIEWRSTKKTELDGYAERMRYTILGDTLTTDILASGARFEYTRRAP